MEKKKKTPLVSILFIPPYSFSITVSQKANGGLRCCRQGTPWTASKHFHHVTECRCSTSRTGRVGGTKTTAHRSEVYDEPKRLKIEMYTWWFPEIVVPLNHPFLWAFFLLDFKPSILDTLIYGNPHIYQHIGIHKIVPWQDLPTHYWPKTENVGIGNCWVRSSQKNGNHKHKIMLQSIQLRTSPNQSCDSRIKTSHFNLDAVIPPLYPELSESATVPQGYPEHVWNVRRKVLSHVDIPSIICVEICLNRVNRCQWEWPWP